MITLAKAIAIANAIQTKAAELGINQTVSIVDAAGRLILTHRADGTGFLTTDTSRAKATASAAFGKSTRDLVELQKNNPAFWNALPQIAPGVLPTTGAVPLFENGILIGAVGCGGGSPEQDHTCATAGAAAFI